MNVYPEFKPNPIDWSKLHGELVRVIVQDIESPIDGQCGIRVVMLAECSEEGIGTLYVVHQEDLESPIERR